MLDAAIADANEDETALMAAIAEEEAAIAKHLISIQSKKQSVQTLVTNISRTGKESTVVKREAEQHARMLGRDRVRCRSLQMKLLSDLQSIYPIRCAVGVSSQSSMNAKQRQADAVGTESGTLIPGGPNHASRSRSASGDVAVNVGVDVDGHQHTSSAANAESVDVHRMNMNMNTSMNTDGNASAGAAYTSVPKAANTVSDASMNQSGSERMPVSPVAASRSGASTSVSTKRNLHNDFIDGGNATSANASIGKTVNHEAHARDGQLASHHHDDNDHVHIHTSANESGAYIIPTIRGLRTPPRSNHAAVANSGRAAYSHSTGVMDNAQTLGQMPPPPSSSAAAAAAAAATKKAAITTKTGTKSTATSTASTAAASTPISDEEASAALGFTCHAILLVSKYLSVPLRHRIIHNSSRSGIMVDKGTMLPLFVARSVNRDELDEALSLLHSNVDTIASSRGINVFGDWHILEKLNVIIGHELRML
uniref:Uncharacterized protein n=1 Tax=Craspedostauros australis TaxID=1486917 RepID=A0A7R9WYK5_9STRA|mmetsp:Transcript_5056/g.13482  ORF Transcript_5056/g.13482 Transcript_5056/m.13482 type:complete len:481 (+) Transcript_5056:2-1444(+)